MNRDTIKKNLITSLQSLKDSKWSSLINSTIGNELISFGVELLAQQEDLRDIYKQSFDFRYADRTSLKLLANRFNIPISFTRPNSIRVKISNSQNKVYKPFSIKCVISEHTFYNVDFVYDKDDIVLYCGTLTAVSSDSSIKDSMCLNINISSTITSASKLNNDTVSPYLGLILDEIIPESLNVYGFKQSDDTTPIKVPLYSPSTNNQTFAYMVELLDNDKYFISPAYETNDSMMSSALVYYLTVDDVELSFDNKSTIELKIAGTSSSIEAYVSSFTTYESNSLSYVRKTLQRGLLNHKALVTKEQIKDYVDSYSFVNSSKVDYSSGTVSVYIKPAEDRIEAFDLIKANLELNSFTFTDFNLICAESMLYKIKIWSNKDVTDIFPNIETLLKETYSYEKTSIDFVPSVTEIKSLINSNYDINSYVTFSVSETIDKTSSKLSAVPLKNTIKIYNTNKTPKGSLVGNDINGYLYINTEYTEYVKTSCTSGFTSDFISQPFYMHHYANNVLVKDISNFTSESTIYDTVFNVNIDSTLLYNSASKLCSSLGIPTKGSSLVDLSILSDYKYTFVIKPSLVSVEINGEIISKYAWNNSYVKFYEGDLLLVANSTITKQTSESRFQSFHTVDENGYNMHFKLDTTDNVIQPLYVDVDDIMLFITFNKNSDNTTSQITLHYFNISLEDATPFFVKGIMCDEGIVLTVWTEGSTVKVLMKHGTGETVTYSCLIITNVNISDVSFYQIPVEFNGSSTISEITHAEFVNSETLICHSYSNNTITTYKITNFVQGASKYIFNFVEYGSANIGTFTANYILSFEDCYLVAKKCNTSSEVSSGISMPYVEYLLIDYNLDSENVVKWTRTVMKKNDEIAGYVDYSTTDLSFKKDDKYIIEYEASELESSKNSFYKLDSIEWTL